VESGAAGYLTTVVSIYLGGFWNGVAFQWCKHPLRQQVASFFIIRKRCVIMYGRSSGVDYALFSKARLAFFPGKIQFDFVFVVSYVAFILRLAKKNWAAHGLKCSNSNIKSQGPVHCKLNLGEKTKKQTS
jgi:hypothetical protein